MATVSAHKIINQSTATQCVSKIFRIALGMEEESEEFIEELSKYFKYDYLREYKIHDSTVEGLEIYESFSKYFVEVLNEFLHKKEYSDLSFDELMSCTMLIVESAIMLLPSKTGTEYLRFAKKLFYSGAYGYLVE